MSFPTYQLYRDSGVEWLGDVPEHWAVKRLKRIADVFPSNIDKKAYEGEVSVRLCNYTNVYYNDVIGDDPEFMAATATLEQIKKFTLRAGDTIITKDSEAADDIAVAAYVPRDLPGVVCGYHLSIVRPFASTSGAFLKRFFDSTFAKASFAVRANGLTRVGLSQYALDNIEVPLPPIGEQQAIAAFLDHETAKIDALVEEQRRLIELLKEKRQAVISHAVTKGLNPNAPMKDSGIEWLGEVPEHWDVALLKRAFREVDYGISASLETEGNVAVLRMGNINGGRVLFDDLKYVSEVAPELILRDGDLLFNRTNSLDLIGKVGVFADVRDTPVSFASYLVRLRTTDEGIPQYFGYLLNTSGVLGEARANALVAIGQCNLNPTRYGELKVALPPKDEQEAIMRFLDIQMTKFDTLVAEAEKAVSFLQERRTALISAAVTGKIDVRPSADVISLPIDRARARGLVAMEIIERMANSNTFGRVKLQKLAYLAEAHVGVPELGGNYLRMAAGPLDSDMVHEMERETTTIYGVSVDQPGGGGTVVTYRTSGRMGRHRAELSQFLGSDRFKRFNKLIVDLIDIGTKGAEAIATLYAVWNDALIDGVDPSDDDIVSSFLNDWHPEKPQKFNADELHIWLGWMRRHGLIPTGSGPKTSTGRLFA